MWDKLRSSQNKSGMLKEGPFQKDSAQSQQKWSMGVRHKQAEERACLLISPEVRIVILWPWGFIGLSNIASFTSLFSPYPNRKKSSIIIRIFPCKTLSTLYKAVHYAALSVIGIFYAHDLLWFWNVQNLQKPESSMLMDWSLLWWLKSQMSTQFLLVWL